MKVAGLAVWGEAPRRPKLTDEQVPLSLSTLASAPPPELDTIGPDHRHRPKPFRPLCPPVDGVDRVDSGGQGGQIEGDLSVKLLYRSVWSFYNLSPGGTVLTDCLLVDYYFRHGCCVCV